MEWKISNYLRQGGRRSDWMRIGAVSAILSVLVLALAPASALAIRQGAQIQLVHAMATFACATFMNIGAFRARYAQGLFVVGSLAYVGPIYIEPLHMGGGGVAVSRLGLALLGGGWLVLTISSSDIDRQRPPAFPERSAPVARADDLEREQEMAT